MLFIIDSVLDKRTELVKGTSVRLEVGSVVEIISVMLVSAIVRMVDVFDRRVLFNAATLYVSVLVKLDVVMEGEPVLFPVISENILYNVVLGITDQKCTLEVELGAFMMFTSFFEFPVLFRGASFEGMLFLQCKVEAVTVVGLVSKLLVLVLGDGLSTEVIDPLELCCSWNAEAGP